MIPLRGRKFGNELHHYDSDQVVVEVKPRSLINTDLLSNVGEGLFQIC